MTTPKSEVPELKRCGFPSCTSPREVELRTVRRNGVGFQVFCHGCGARGPFRYDKSIAVEAWNTRPYQNWTEVRERDKLIGELESLAVRIAGHLNSNCMDRTKLNAIEFEIEEARPSLLSDKGEGGTT